VPTLTSLKVLLQGDASSLVKATRVGLSAVKGFGRAAGKATLIAGAAGVAGLGAAAAGLTALGNAARNSIDAHAKNAARLGITVSEAQRLSQAAEQSDVKVRTLGTAMAAIAREAGKAADGSKKSAQKFLDLGISMDQVKKASPFELLQSVIGALGKTGSFTERAAKANALLGDSWLKLNPLINGGNDAFADANTIFVKLGLGIGKNSAEVERFNDKLDSLGRLGRALRDKVFATLAPQLADFAEKLFNGAAAMIEAAGGGEAFARMLSTTLVDGIRTAIDWFGGLKTIIDGVLTVAGFLVDVFQGIGTFGAGLAAAAGALLEGNFAGAGAVLSAIPGDVISQFEDDTSEEQLQETKRQTNLLEDLVRTAAPSFQ